MSSDTPTTNGMSRREELLAVATKLFAARGYHGTRMDDVADEVGLNKATVYHYYASKSLILYDIYKGAADFTVAALHDDPSASARETIYHFTRRLLVGIANNIEQAAVYFQEGPYITEWFTEDQVAYIRTPRHRSTSMCATSSTAASPAASSMTATPTCWHLATSA